MWSKKCEKLTTQFNELLIGKNALTKAVREF